MLHISTAKVRNVTQLLRKIEVMRPDARIESAPYEDLEDLLKRLRPDEKVDLVSLLYIGRGDFTEDEWDDCWNQAEDEDGEYELIELLTEAASSDLIEEGLSLIGEAGEDDDEDEDEDEDEY